MPPRSYSSYKGKRSTQRETSDYVPVGPALDDYEKSLRDNPGKGDSAPWFVNVVNDFFGMGRPQDSIKKVIEEGEDAPVIGPAIGATGRLFDVLSRGNFAAANFTEELQGENLADEDLSFMEQLKKIWQVGATIPAAALPMGLGDFITGADSDNVPEALRGAVSGISGTRKNNFGELLEQGGVENNQLRGWGGFGLDVALDPTTYVGTGLVKGLNKGEDAAATIAREVGAGPTPGGMSNFDNLIRNTPAPRPGETPVIDNWMTGQVVPEAPTAPLNALETSAGGFDEAISALPTDVKPTTVSPFGFIAPKASITPVEEVATRAGLDLPTGVDKADDVIDVTKALPAEEVSRILADNSLGAAFPEKIEEAKWLGLFDDTTPEVLKKNFRPEPGVELITKVDPDELRILAESPSATAGEDWVTAKGAYEPDGPVDIPLKDLATDPIEGLLKAPYEVGSSVRVPDGIPPHRQFLHKGEGPKNPRKVDANSVRPGWKPPENFDDGFNLGTLPGVPKNADKGYIGLRLAGVDIVRSNRAYNIGRSILKPFLYGDGAANTLAKAFSMNAHLPDGMDQMLRVAQNTRMANFDRSSRAIVNHLGKLTDGERRQIMLAIDSNTNLTEFAATHTDDTFQTLEDYRQLAKGLFREAHAAESAQGLVGKRIDNYVKRMVKPGTDPKKLATMKNKDGSFTHSVQDLIDKGVEIETDIAEILRERLATSARVLTKADMEWESLMRFGVPNNVVRQHPDLIEKFDLVKWKSSSKEARSFGHYIPRKHAEALDWFSQITLKDAESAKLGHLLDKAVGEWKYLALLTPGRHVRDTVGDVIMNAQAGVWNPNSYRKATKVLGLLTPNKNVREMYEKNVVALKEGTEATAGDLGSITVAGQRVPIETMWEDIYVGSGAKSGQLSTEVQRMMNAARGSGERRALSPFKPYDALKRGVGRMSDAREDWSRLSHVIDYLDRKATKPILNEHGKLNSYGLQLAKEAGESVRKWNIDYGNLTPFEQNTARRLIPFYTFMRHNTPRQMELLFTKPGFMALYPKGNNLMQGVFGTDNGDDHLLPPWVRETAPFRIQMQKQEQKGALGWVLDKFGAQPGMQVLGDPNTSMTPLGNITMLNALGDPTNPLMATAREFGSMVTPALKIPAELMTDESLFNGAPINGDYYKYFAGQFPQSRMAYGRDPASTMRTLTGLPIRPITEKMQDNEAYRRELEMKRLFKDRLARTLPAQYRGMDPAKQREIQRNLIIAQEASGTGG